MGRALARRMAERGDALFLLGRDRATSRAAPPTSRSRGAPAPVGVAHLRPARSPEASRRRSTRADARSAGFDTVVVTAGLFATQERSRRTRSCAPRCSPPTSPTRSCFCEQARARLLARGGGTLCVFCSVAGDRARKPVILYGAAKAGLSHYLEGLDHKFRRAGLRTVCVKPGFVKTGMTAGPAGAAVRRRARRGRARVLRAIDRGTPVVYAPGIWRLVLGVIRWLPRSVMRRIGF